MRTSRLLAIVLAMASLLAYPLAGAALYGPEHPAGQYFCQSDDDEEEKKKLPEQEEEEEEEPDCD